MSYEVFQCPKCHQYISTKYDVCRFCSLPLTEEIKVQAIGKEEEGSRQHRINSHKTFLYTGLATFGLGVFLLLFSVTTILFTREGRFFIWSPVLIVLGLGQIYMGYSDMRREKKK